MDKSEREGVGCVFHTCYKSVDCLLQGQVCKHVFKQNELISDKSIATFQSFTLWLSDFKCFRFFVKVVI